MSCSIFNKERSSIFYATFWDTINCFGVQSILILFLVKHFGFSDNESYTIYGDYVALAFGFSILGGLVADKMLGTYRTALLGCILIFFGNLILMFSQIQLFFIGLSFVLVGFGMLKPNTPNLIKFSHKQEDSVEREKIFSLFYLYLNLGSISGPILYGFFYDKDCCWVAYLFGAIGIASVFYFLNLCKKSLANQTESINDINYIFIALIVGCSVLVSYLLLRYQQLFLGFFLIIVMIVIYFLYVMLKKISFQERLFLIELLPLFVSSFVFFAVLLQIYSSLTLFIDRYVNKMIFGWHISTAWFSSIEPIMLLMTVYFLNTCWGWLAKKRLEVKPFYKSIIGLIFVAAAFLSFFSTASLEKEHHMIALFFLLLGYSLLAIGDLSIIPVTLSLTNLLSPQKYKGMMMGFFYLVLMFSGCLSTFIASQASSTVALQTQFGHLFLGIVVMLIVIIFLLLLFNILISKANNLNLIKSSLALR